MDIEGLIQKEKGRLFIDIATEGCGSGCTYCYISDSIALQKLISLTELGQVIDRTASLISDGDILSFCPNTEPLKTDESRHYIYDILANFRSNNVIFQISTKESIPESFLEKLNSINTVNPIYISISIPFLETCFYEPYAATLQERLENFNRIRKFTNLCSCLYIKPFNSSNLSKKDEFAKFVTDFCPDHICVGLQFKENSVRTCSTLHDINKATELINNTDLNDLYAFTDYIRKMTGKKVFHSSVCNVANSVNINCILDIVSIDNRFCSDCSRKCVCP